MTNSRPPVYVAATCSACGSKNQLTISSGSEEQDVSCSHCGTRLGRVASLANAAAAATGESHVAEPPPATPATVLGQLATGRQ
jgi:DNA-directed RNA polymerase subunit RPC12/RpoP